VAAGTNGEEGSQIMEHRVIVCASALDIAMQAGPDIADITERIAEIVAQSKITDGSVHLSAMGSTASLTTIEFEPGAIADLKAAIERLAPPGARYAHEMAWHDGNGHSHVQAALLGPSLVVAVRSGQLRLGTWQQIVLINHDNRPRRRHVDVTVIGYT
jgi:secondary thiamine-phosphate synthase enzyme